MVILRDIRYLVLGIRGGVANATFILKLPRGYASYFDCSTLFAKYGTGPCECKLSYFYHFMLRITYIASVIAENIFSTNRNIKALFGDYCNLESAKVN